MGLPLTERYNQREDTQDVTWPFQIRGSRVHILELKQDEGHEQAGLEYVEVINVEMASLH